MKPTRLTIQQFVKVLRAAGSKNAAEQTIREDLDAGAPANPDGTINLMHYAAWLVRENGCA